MEPLTTSRYSLRSTHVAGYFFLDPRLRGDDRGECGMTGLVDCVGVVINCSGRDCRVSFDSLRSLHSTRYARSGQAPSTPYGRSIRLVMLAHGKQGRHGKHGKHGSPFDKLRTGKNDNILDLRIKLRVHQLQEPITYQMRRFWRWHTFCLIGKLIWLWWRA